MSPLKPTIAMALVLLAGCDMLVSGKRGEVPAKAAPKPPSADAASAAPAAPAAGEPAAGEKAAEPKKEVPADPLDAAIASQEGYVYNPIGKRDPFRSFLAQANAEADDSPRTPLQRFDLDQYQLVGVVYGIDRPRALVQDPERVGHVVEIGTYIGKNWGKVTQITSSGAVVTEEYQTIDGELVVNEIPMKLPDNTGAERKQR